MKRGYIVIVSVLLILIIAFGFFYFFQPQISGYAFLEPTNTEEIIVARYYTEDSGLVFDADGNSYREFREILIN